MNREAERQRLVELLKLPSNCMPNAKCESCGLNGGCSVQRQADKLLDNGIVVLPCQVGQKVYYPSGSFDRIFEKTVDEILINENESDKGYYIHFSSTYMPFENIGKTVFLTREEAEKALERKEDGK